MVTIVFVFGNTWTVVKQLVVCCRNKLLSVDSLSFLDTFHF